MRRAIAPVAALLTTLALQAPASASVVTEQATHGTVKVRVQHFRCNFYDLELAGSFRVGVRTWTGVASTTACLTPGGSHEPSATFTGTSTDGYFYAQCTTSLFADPTFDGGITTPAAFTCKANAGGHGLLPLAFEITTVPNVVTDEPYVEQIGVFDGV